MLPLLEVAVPERMRNASLQCKTIRNLVVHNKATPTLAADVGTRPNDWTVASERADRFFAENPIERLQRDLQEFVDNGIEDNPAVQRARRLFAKFFGISEADFALMKAIGLLDGA